MKPLRLLLTVMLLLLSPLAQAELRVSNAFGEHMVLQQEMPIRVWGWADPGATVVVGLDDGAKVSSISIKAGDDGKWLAELPARKAEGKTCTLQIVSGDATIKLSDILLGEVWICSGQSNMEWPVSKAANSAAEIANADHPTIRLFNVPEHIKQATPQDDAQAAPWQVCSPETVGGFSAVGYYFGRELNRSLNVPIGLVGTNWGGQKIELFTPPAGFAQVKDIEKLAGNTSGMKEASMIYNGMVAGLTPMSARGAIWYQGESNAADGLKYDTLKEALVKGWRSEFKNEELSFYWVQLADFGKGHSGKPEGGGWGPVREAQRRALRITNTGMAVTMDIGDAGNIHPTNKQEVGKRLSLWALAKNYGKGIAYSGPLYKSHEIKGDKVIIHFDHVGGGLMAGTKGGENRMDPVRETPGAELLAFSLRDNDGTWHFARAVIDGDTVVVSSEEVSKPTAVRYAYDSDPDVNFYNKEGLPASPFSAEK